ALGVAVAGVEGGDVLQALEGADAGGGDSEQGDCGDDHLVGVADLAAEPACRLDRPVGVGAGEDVAEPGGHAAVVADHGVAVVGEPQVGHPADRGLAVESAVDVAQLEDGVAYGGAVERGDGGGEVFAGDGGL